MNILIRELDGGAPVLDEDAVKQFQRQWATYQKLVDTDVLSHKAVSALLRDAVTERGEPFSILDIACGDAHLMARTLTGTKVARYRGVDLSEAALMLARENLKDASFDVELDHGDFVAALQKAPEPTDVAWCGLSIHHLHTPEKLDLLRAIHGATAGFLMIYEPTLGDGETRDGYMARYARENSELKAVLSDLEWGQILRHVTDCDFPEAPQTWLSLGRNAGFSRAQELFRDPTGFYRVYKFDR